MEYDNVELVKEAIVLAIAKGATLQNCNYKSY